MHTTTSGTGADNLPLIGWKACEAKFVFMSDFGHEGALPLSESEAVNHWDNGTAIFLENAAREVKILSAFYRIERLNREFSYRVSFLQAEGSSLENACNIAQEEIDEAVKARRAL